MPHWISGTLKMMAICYACGDLAIGRCTWPTDKWRILCVRDLLHGDICMTMDESRTGKIIEIQAVLNVPNPNLQEFTVERIWSKGRPQIRVDTYRWDMRASIKVRRTMVCGTPACFRHIRDLHGGYICSDHWGAQLALVTSNSHRAATPGRHETNEAKA